jgi:hypothetical protein
MQLYDIALSKNNYTGILVRELYKTSKLDNYLSYIFNEQISGKALFQDYNHPPSPAQQAALQVTPTPGWLPKE